MRAAPEGSADGEWVSIVATVRNRERTRLAAEARLVLSGEVAAVQTIAVPANDARTVEWIRPLRSLRGHETVTVAVVATTGLERTDSPTPTATTAELSWVTVLAALVALAVLLGWTRRR